MKILFGKIKYESFFPEVHPKMFHYLNISPF